MKRAFGDPWRPRLRSLLLLPFVLRVVDRLERPLRAFGVEPVAFRAILTLRLELDLRESSFAGSGTGSAGSPGASFQVGLALIATGFWLAGMMPGIAAFFVEDSFLWMALGQGMVSGMIVMVLLSHFATLLVDATDVDVIGPLPVPGRTLFAARLAHTFVYMGLLGGVFAIWPTFLGCFRHPWWLVLPLVPLATFLSSLLALAAVGLLFTAALRLFGPSAFQRAVLWIQVGATAFTFGGFQLLVRALPMEAITAAASEFPPWLALLPPFCFGSLFEVARGNLGGLRWLGALLAFVLPLGAAFVAVRLATGHFAQALGGAVTRGRQRVGFARGLFARLSPRLCATPEERAGFELGLAMSRREPMFVRAIWSQVIGFTAMGLALTLVPGPGVEWLGVYGVLMTLYLFVVLAPGALETSQVGSSSEARWIYHLVTHERRRRVLLGSTKALLVGTAAPAFLLAALLLLLVGGPGVLPDVLLVATTGTALTLNAGRRMKLSLPFVMDLRAATPSLRNLPTVFGMLLALGLLALVHVLLRLLHPLAPLAGAGLAAFWMLWELRRFRGPELVRDPDTPPEMRRGLAPVASDGSR